MMTEQEREMYVGKDGTSHLANSRKGQLHRTFDEGGTDAMVKEGRKLGLSESTIRTCLNRWGGAAKANKALGKAPKVAKAATRAVVSEAAEIQGFTVDYRYRSEGAAANAAAMIAERNGMRPECFGIGEGGGKWAVIPRHLDPNVKPPAFAVGMRVANLTWPIKRGLGTVQAVGEATVDVLWDDGVHTNSSFFYLEPQRDEPKPGPKEKGLPKHEPEVEAAKQRKAKKKPNALGKKALAKARVLNALADAKKPKKK